MTDADFDYVRRLVHERAAIVLDESKAYLVAARLGPLARKEADGSVAGLIQRLRARPSAELRDRVVEAMATHETSFFREPAAFAALRREVLPRLVAARAPARRLDVWSAGCASGQEAYSLAIAVEQCFPILPGWTIRVRGTDLSAALIERARGGVYTQAEIERGLAPELLPRYFEPVDSAWRVKEPIRRLTEFTPLNLVDDWSFVPPMDVVFMRNVLLYLDEPARRRILARVRQLLRPDGCLFLGSAEAAIAALEPAFVPVQVGRGTHYRLA